MEEEEIARMVTTEDSHNLAQSTKAGVYQYPFIYKKVPLQVGRRSTKRGNHICV